MSRLHAAAPIAAVVLVLAALVQPAGVLASDERTPAAGELSAKWWQWAFSIPVHKPPYSSTLYHPLVDLIGTQCGDGQSGPIWFLGGAFFPNGAQTTTSIDRTCVMPAGEALFFPMFNVECSVLEGPAYGCAATVPENRAIVKYIADHAANMTADLDGNTILAPGGDASSFRAASPSFVFQLPADYVLTFIGQRNYDAGIRSLAVADGYYVALPPLGVGQHTLRFHGEVPDFGFVLDVMYRLTVSDHQAR